MTKVSDLVRLVSIADFETNSVVRVDVDGRPAVAVFRLEDDFYVTDDLCTHGNASLSDGEIVGIEVECPFHGGSFDIRTGAACKYPCTSALTVYPAQVEQGWVCAALQHGSRITD